MANMCCIDFETIGSITLKWFQIIFPPPTERSVFMKTLTPCLANVCNVYKNLFKDLRCHHQCFRCAFNALLLYLWLEIWVAVFIWESVVLLSALSVLVEKDTGYLPTQSCCCLCSIWLEPDRRLWITRLRKGQSYEKVKGLTQTCGLACAKMSQHNMPILYILTKMSETVSWLITSFIESICQTVDSLTLFHKQPFFFNKWVFRWQLLNF